MEVEGAYKALDDGWRSKVMVTSQYILRLSCVGNTNLNGALKNVSFEAHGGELATVLGTGKRELLKIISQRTTSLNRGAVSLNGVKMTRRLFQESCSFVSREFFLPIGLTTLQMLSYACNLSIGQSVHFEIKSIRVKEVLSDFRLSKVANCLIGSLTKSEQLLLLIAVQVVRDPVVLLLDQPTLDMDPLSTFQVANTLSNYARKYNRIIVMTMDQARSDIFPFLDRVTYLSLGQVIFTGATRTMVDYFSSIGFPCPERENPLMYFLFLQSLDQRDEESLSKSIQLVKFLAEKFNLEGKNYREYVGPAPGIESFKTYQKVPLSVFGRPQTVSVLSTLVRRSLRQFFIPKSLDCVAILLTRLFMLPAFSTILWIFYFSGLKNARLQSQSDFVTRNGLVMNILAGTYFSAIISSTSSFPSEHRQHFREVIDGAYSGKVFIVANAVQSLFLSGLSTLLSSLILLKGLRQDDYCERNSAFDNITYASISSDSQEDNMDGVIFRTPNSLLFHFWVFWFTLWIATLFSEQLTITTFVFVKSSFKASIVSIFVTIIFFVLGSGSLKSFSSLPGSLNQLTKVIQARYVGAVLNNLEFFNPMLLKNFTITNGTFCCRSAQCRYVDGNHFLLEKYGSEDIFSDPLSNWAISTAFPTCLFLLNMILYSVPFREERISLN